MKEEHGFLADRLTRSWRTNSIPLFRCLASWMIRLIHRSDGLLPWVGKWETLTAMENKAKVTETAFKTHGYTIALSWFDPGIWSLRWISLCYLRYLLIKNNQRRGSSWEQKVSHWRSNQAVHLLTSIKSKQYNMLFSTRYKICFETFLSCFGVSFSFWSHAGGNRDHKMPRFMRI